MCVCVCVYVCVRTYICLIKEEHISLYLISWLFIHSVLCLLTCLEYQPHRSVFLVMTVFIMSDQVVKYAFLRNTE